MRAILILLLGLFTFPARAHQPREGRIYGSFGPYLLRTIPEKHGFDSALTSGVGVTVNGDVDQNGGLEISVFFLNKLVSLEQDSHVITQISDRVFITSGYRHWFLPNLGVGLGFFSSYLMGSPKTLQSDFATSPPKTSAGDTTEYGIELSVQVEPWQGESFTPLVDFRYARSLTDKPNEDGDHLGVYVAAKFFVQGK